VNARDWRKRPESCGLAGLIALRGAVRGQRARLMPRRPLHPTIHVRCEVLVGAEFSGLVAAIDPDAFCRSRRVVREHHRKERQRADVLEGAARLFFAVARLVRRPRLLRVELALDVIQHPSFPLALRDDQRMVVHRRHVQFHAVELQQMRNQLTRRFPLGVRARQIELRMIRSPMIGRHHP